MKSLFPIFYFLLPVSYALTAESERLVPVILEQMISREKIYPQQPVELSVSLYVEDAVKNSLGLDPFTRAASYQRGHTPTLSLSWAEDQKIPKSLYPVEPREIWADSIPQGRIGFTLPGAVSSFNYDLSTQLFYPIPEKVIRENSEGKETLYWKYTIRRRLVPTAPGKVVFPQARYSGIMLGTALDSDSQPVPRPVAVTVESEPVHLTVLDVPEENRPENDVGLFGLFDWSVELTPKTAKVGEPLTLTITFQGVGSITHAKAPNLAQISPIAGHFRIYPATEEMGEDFYRFIYTVRPKLSGNILFPEITVSYFHVEEERFVELKSRPIPIMVTDAEQVDASAITRGRVTLSPKRNEPVLTESGIFANLTEAGGGRNQRVSPKFYFSLFGVLAVTWLVVAVCLFLYRVRSRMLCAPNSTASAIQRARERFARLPELLTANKPHEACVQMQNTLIDFIAQVTQGMTTGITPAEAMEIVRNWELQEPRMKELGDLFEHLDAIRFGALPPQQAAQSVKRGTAILEDLIDAIPTPGRSRV